MLFLTWETQNRLKSGRLLLNLSCCSSRWHRWFVTGLSDTAAEAKGLQIHNTEALIEGQQTGLLLTLLQRDSEQLLPSLNETNFNVTK